MIAWRERGMKGPSHRRRMKRSGIDYSRRESRRLERRRLLTEISQRRSWRPLRRWQGRRCGTRGRARGRERERHRDSCRTSGSGARGHGVCRQNRVRSLMLFFDLHCRGPTCLCWEARRRWARGHGAVSTQLRLRHDHWCRRGHGTP